MTETTTYTVTTKPREGGKKLAITVEGAGQKVTKVTGRTYPYVVVEMDFTSYHWNAKTREMDRGSFLDVNVVKGTANRAVADKTFSQTRQSLRPGGAVIVLARYGDQYTIIRNSYLASTGV